MDKNSEFLLRELCGHFANARFTGENDEPEEETEEDGGEDETDDPKPSTSGHRIDTERRRCECGAKLCFTCGWCSADCICPEKTRGFIQP